MVVFGNCLYSGKNKSGCIRVIIVDCIRAKVLVFGQKWLYSGTKVLLYSGKVVVFGLAKVVVFVQSGCVREKVVVFGQSGIHSGKSGFIRSKWLFFGKSCCIRGK